MTKVQVTLMFSSFLSTFHSSAGSFASLLTPMSKQFPLNNMKIIGQEEEKTLAIYKVHKT